MDKWKEKKKITDLIQKKSPMPPLEKGQQFPSFKAFREAVGE